MKKLNNKGFGVMGVLAVIVIIAAAGGIGAYVYHKHHKANSNTTSSTSSSNGSSAGKTGGTTQSPDPTADWSTYSSTSGKFALKYPKTWATAANPSQCQDGIFLLGGNSSAVGSCGSNNFGQMTITWQPVRTSCGLGSTYWTTNSTTAVTVSGVSGTETTGTAKAGGSVPEGTTTTQYCFVRSGTMYVANYTQLSTYPDVLSDFNLMVAKTLSFN